MEVKSERATIVALPEWNNGFFYAIRTKDNVYLLNSRDVEEGVELGSRGFFQIAGKRKYFFLEEPCLKDIKESRRKEQFRKVIVR